jgi:hypothetical protein
MSVWDTLAEARIREWLERPAAERNATNIPLEPGLPLEVQLQPDVAQLDRMAAAAVDVDEAAALKKQADALMIRLMIILEDHRVWR